MCRGSASRSLPAWREGPLRLHMRVCSELPETAPGGSNIRLNLSIQSRNRISLT